MKPRDFLGAYVTINVKELVPSMTRNAPRWLNRLERHLGWIGIPNIALIFVTLQGLGWLMVSTNPLWMERLALVPDRVLAGEYWRLITFLALPVSMNIIWVIFWLWFLYFVLDLIEKEWGEFKTTLYVLVGCVLTIAFSFAFDVPIYDITDFQTSLFLAAATLFPEMVIQLYLIIPVKMKWLGWLSGGYVVYRLIESSWLGRLYFLAIYSSYVIFFGPALIERVRNDIRRWNYKRKSRW